MQIELCKKRQLEMLRIFLMLNVSPRSTVWLIKYEFDQNFQHVLAGQSFWNRFCVAKFCKICTNYVIHQDVSTS